MLTRGGKQSFVMPLPGRLTAPRPPALVNIDDLPCTIGPDGLRIGAGRRVEWQVEPGLHRDLVDRVFVHLDRQ